MLFVVYLMETEEEAWFHFTIDWHLIDSTASSVFPLQNKLFEPKPWFLFSHSVIQRLSRVMEIWKEILQFSLTEHEHTSRLPDIPWLVLVVRLKITEIYYYHNCYKCLRACLLLDAQTVKGFSEHCCLMGLCEKNAIGPQAFFKSA